MRHSTRIYSIDRFLNLNKHCHSYDSKHSAYKYPPADCSIVQLINEQRVFKMITKPLVSLALVIALHHWLESTGAKPKIISDCSNYHFQAYLLTNNVTTEFLQILSVFLRLRLATPLTIDISIHYNYETILIFCSEICASTMLFPQVTNSSNGFAMNYEAQSCYKE